MSNRQIGEDEFPEFDFGTATRGSHFAGPNAALLFPGDRVPLDRLVNEILKKEIEKRKKNRR